MERQQVKMGDASKIFFEEAAGLIAKHQRNLPPEYLLALASKLVGRIMMVQDRSKYTHDQIMAIIVDNIKVGNGDMIRDQAQRELLGKVAKGGIN